MKRKIIVFCISIILILVTISIATAFGTIKNSIKKESPLYGIRTKQGTSEKTEKLIQNLNLWFIGKRIYFKPSILLQNNVNIPLRYRLAAKTIGITCTCISGGPAFCGCN